MKYDSLDEAAHRLGSTVIMFGKDPVFIRGVEQRSPEGKQGEFLVAQVLPGAKTTVYEELQNPKFNVQRFNLGFCNTKNDSIYVRRSPVRRFKQGLNQENLIIPFSALKEYQVEDIDELPEENGQIRAIRWEEFYRTTAFSNMLKNQYPSMEVCLEKVRKSEKLKAIAFSSYLALIRTRIDLVCLKYKLETIGYEIVNGKFKIGKEFGWLKETIEESGVRMV